MHEAAKAPEEQRELVGLVGKKRRLMKEFIVVDVEIYELRSKIQADPALEQEFQRLKKLCSKTRLPRMATSHNKLNNIELGVSPLDR